MRPHYYLLVLSMVGLFFSVSVYSGDAYQLGANDVVRVTVYGQPDLSTTARISEKGTISLPVVGEVSIAGLTAREAERRLVTVLTQKDVVKAPQVGVFVEEFQSQRVSVVGQVAKPGVYAITRGGTVLDLISEAGGLNAEAGDIAILTRARRGGEERVVIDLRQVLEGRSGAVEPRVSDGDRIFVPRMEQFYVYGEVKKPGAYRYERGMTVMQALAIAGGLSEKGTERGMKIRRKRGDGAEETLPASLSQEIQPSDVLQVKESLF